MITELHLKNFRGFKDHIVPLKPFTIVVGRNNAGKSTIAEALRLISIVVSRFKGDLAAIPTKWEFPKNRRGPSHLKISKLIYKAFSTNTATPLQLYVQSFLRVRLLKSLSLARK